MSVPFTLLQLEAFTAVGRYGSITRAARALQKDRTTVSELINNLEIDLGYSLFDRQTRPLQLTTQGDRLYRQAMLFLQEAQAFSGIACQLAEGQPLSLTLSYDTFTPHATLIRLAQQLAASGITLNLRCESRESGEQALCLGEADIGVYQALNRPVSQSFSWRALGAIELAVYASPALFRHHPVSMSQLASHTQLLPWNGISAALSQRLQIADRVQSVNERELLLALLQAGESWALLPTHFFTTPLSGVERIETAMGREGMLHPMVALWQPGNVEHIALRHVLERLEGNFAA